MNCTIDAWLDDDTAHLRITDVDSGRVHLDWSWSGRDANQGDADTALHRLVSGLFLVSCIGKLRHPVAGSAPPRPPTAPDHPAPVEQIPVERIAAEQVSADQRPLPRTDPLPPAESRVIEFRRAAGHS